jgi:predicted Zn-dependent protease
VSRPAGGLAAAIRAALARRTGIHAWQLQSDERSGFQTYLVRDAAESERRVHGESHTLTVFVKHGDLLGRSTRTLGPADAAQLDARIDEAVFMAGLGGDAPWELPRSAAAVDVPLFDPLLADARVRETSRSVADRWRAAVQKQHGARPSSMELFCGGNVTTLANSAGLELTTRGSRVSMLTLLLADGTHPSERQSYDERRRIADLDVEGIVTRVATQAHDLTEAAPPPSGSYAVVLDAEELTNFLAPIQNQSSAVGLYQKSSRFEAGKPLPIPAGGGEPLTVVSNATAPYGLQSYAFDGDGVPGQRVEIVKDGVFARPWATKQFADYLGTSATGGWANWEVPAGKTPVAELLANGGRVLQVCAFSWLLPDGNRGDFGSEIRVGYLYENGTRRTVKGGTVGGNVFTALGTAHWAQETVFRGDYLGPQAVRFEGLTVSGS